MLNQTFSCEILRSMDLISQPLLPRSARSLLALLPLAALWYQGLAPWQGSASLALISGGVLLWIWQQPRPARILLVVAVILISLMLMLSLSNGSGSIYPLSLLLSTLAALMLPQRDAPMRITACALALLGVSIAAAGQISSTLQLEPTNDMLTALSAAQLPLWGPLSVGLMVFLQLQRWRLQLPVFRIPVLAPLALLLGVLATLYATLSAEQQLQQELKQQTLQRNSQLANDLLGHLRNQNQALERLAQQWVQMQSLPQSLWQRQSQLLMQDFDNFYSLEWIDNDLVIRWVEPAFADPNILNFRFRPDHPAYPYLMLARTTRQQVTTGIYRLIPGDLGFTVYTPIFLTPEQQQGYLVSVYQLGPFITNNLRNPIYAQYALRVLFQGQEVYSSPGYRVDAPLTTRINVPAPLNWQLLLQPNSQQQLSHQQEHLTPALILSSGLLMSLLLGLVLYLVRHYLRQQAKSEASQCKLQEEVIQRQQTAQTLLETNRQMELFYDLINQSRDALMIVNPDNHELIYYNSSTFNVLGYQEPEFLEAIRQPEGDLHEAMDELIERAQQSRRRFGSAVYEMELPRQDMSLLPVEVSIRTVSKDGHTYLTIVLHDVTAHKELQHRLLEMATKDPLTQINNRRQFDAELKTEWARMLRAQQPLSLLFMDVDRFKDYNDSLGHQQGDSCLRTIANLLQSALSRASDSAARYGGEEFAVILPHTDRQGAEQVAENIHRKLAQAAIPHPSSDITPLVSLSIGVCTLTPNTAGSVDELIRRADQALYRAKASGRNRTEVIAEEGDESMIAEPLDPAAQIQT